MKIIRGDKRVPVHLTKTYQVLAFDLKAASKPLPALKARKGHRKAVSGVKAVRTENISTIYHI